jgi:Ca2+-binding EF-hand superfamily protein
LFQYFQKKVAQVAKKKEAQIVQAQLSKEIMAEQNANVRELAVQRAKVAKQEEQELIVIQNKRVREAADLRKIEIEKEKVLIELEKEKVIQAKKEKALVLIAREREKVLEEAKLKGDKIKEQAKIAVQKKIKLEEEEEEQKVLIEIEKQKIRVFNARRAEVERQFTRVQLEALREQFDEADADNSDSIDANELMAVCRSLGENLSMKQVKALIAEVDDDGSGEIEWEEYLIIMGKKRNDAMKKGSGLFQKMSMRADEAANKKQEQIAVAQRAKEENYELQEFNRKAAVKRAEAQKIIEQQKIVDRNIIKEEEAMVRVEEVEIEKEMQLRIKAQKAYEKEQLGRQRVIVEKNKIWEQAEAKRLRTESNLERAAWLKNKQIYDEEQKIIEAEKLRVVKRQSKVKRADVERQFTRVQLEALREQFDEADADNSDSIDANELMAVCQSLGENVSMKQVKQMIAEVDDDGSGEIEWDEYLIIMGKKRKDAMKKGEQSYWWCSVLGE